MLLCRSSRPRSVSSTGPVMSATSPQTHDTASRSSSVSVASIVTVTLPSHTDSVASCSARRRIAVRRRSISSAAASRSWLLAGDSTGCRPSSSSAAIARSRSGRPSHVRFSRSVNLSLLQCIFCAVLVLRITTNYCTLQLVPR